jgi:hypothetical protein
MKSLALHDRGGVGADGACPVRNGRLSAETPVDSCIASMARKRKRLRFVVQQKKG